MGGLKPNMRNRYGKKSYKDYLRCSHVSLVEISETEDSLFECVQRWLARCPYLHDDKDWNFWILYCEGIEKMKKHERNMILTQKDLTKEKLSENLINLRKQHERWSLLLDKTIFEQIRKKEKIRLTFEAFLGALFINLYRKEWSLQVPHQILTDIMDIEKVLRAFRT